MKKNRVKIIIAGAVLLCLTGCGKTEKKTEAKEAPDIKEALIKEADNLEKSKELYFEDGLTITGMGINYSGDVTRKNDNFFWTSIAKMTGVNLDILWQESDEYMSSLSATLLTGVDNLPDILNASDFGVMDLADDGVVVALDDYLELIPNIVAAVGEERMDYWRQADGHIYTIPNVTNVQGAQTMMIRKDWLDKLGLSEPQNWDEWVELWRAIRDNDLNGNGDSSDEIPFAVQLGENGERCLLPLLNAFGIKSSSDTQFCQLEDGTYTLIYEHPKYPEFLKAMQELYSEGLIDRDFDSMYADKMDALMDENKVGTSYNWAERCRTSTQVLRDSGVSEALWEAVSPISGPDGVQMTPERIMVAPIWCITSSAKENGKIEDILRFFNWYFSQEGSYLYSYGLSGVSYEMDGENPVLSKELVANGFKDYRTAGCNIECFGGFMQESAFLQCLFEGCSEENMDELTEEFYKGISVVNQNYFYTMPQTYQTPAYIKYRNTLLTEGMCKVRNQAIKGELSVEEFFNQYEELKKQGLENIITELVGVGEN